MKKVKVVKISKKHLKKIKFRYEVLEENERFVKIRYTDYKETSYENLIINAIRKRYSIDQELAILRQRDVKPEEFLDYNTYVEECKATAKAFVEEREAARLPRPIKEKKEEEPEQIEESEE